MEIHSSTGVLKTVSLFCHMFCKFQLWLPWLAGLPYQFSTMKQRTSFSEMEEWEGVLGGRGDGVSDGDGVGADDAEWFPLMKSGACSLCRGLLLLPLLLPPLLLLIVVAVVGVALTTAASPRGPKACACVWDAGVVVRATPPPPAVNSVPIMLWSWEESRKLVSASVERRIPSE